MPSLTENSITDAATGNPYGQVQGNAKGFHKGGFAGHIAPVRNNTLLSDRRFTELATAFSMPG